jgi:sugar lactone lactonase YvrE
VGEHLYYAQPDRPDVWMYDLEGNEVGRHRGPASQVALGDSVPVYSKLIGDADRNLWAMAGDDTGRWFVFEPSGGYVGWVLMPADLDVWQIGEGFVLGVETDDLGVERVRVYRLDAGSG